ncbi:dihydroxyacetone kinase subunit DhaK [Streptomyces sp. NPDC002668]|uniref:dihydroxyacetone kinase subunit DhaK n=1 Tax=Streptomyces sp. NPDC002668 TaxID=3154422 RepID=UPI00332D722F
MAYEVAGGRAAKNVTTARSLAGNHMTSPDMPGLSTTVRRADADMLSSWDAPVHTFALRRGA